MFLGLAAQVLSDRCERSDGAGSGVPVDERRPDGVFEGGQLGVQVGWDAAGPTCAAGTVNLPKPVQSLRFGALNAAMASEVSPASVSM